MGYTVQLGDQPREFLSNADSKTERIVKDNLRKLEDEPYPKPGAGKGDREKVNDDPEVYRCHVSHSYTAFYKIIKNKSRVNVVEIMTIDAAHKKYGDL